MSKIVQIPTSKTVDLDPVTNLPRIVLHFTDIDLDNITKVRHLVDITFKPSYGLFLKDGSLVKINLELIQDYEGLYPDGKQKFDEIKENFERINGAYDMSGLRRNMSIDNIIKLTEDKINYNIFDQLEIMTGPTIDFNGQTIEAKTILVTMLDFDLSDEEMAIQFAEQINNAFVEFKAKGVKIFFKYILQLFKGIDDDATSKLGMKIRFATL